MNFNVLGDLTILDNSIFFSGIDMNQKYGVVPGDYITTSGASNGANNVTLKQIDQFVKTDEGSYIVVNDVSFVVETMTAATVSFRSQYDTLHPTAGLKMANYEVDILQHEKIKRWFLSSMEYDFYIRDTQNGKDFVEQQIYFPVAVYSVPRKAQSSIGYHIGPLPSSEVKVMDTSRVIEPDRLRVSRSINKNFYNTIVYKFEEKVLEEDKFTRGVITTDGPSRDQVQIGTRALIIPAKGVRESLGGSNLATSQSNRRLRRYRVGAETIESMRITLGYSFNLEIGDVVVIDMTDLKISDTHSGTRQGLPRLFEVVDKRLDIKTGNVTFSLLDTAYSTATRYFLMSPSSRILSSTTTQIKLRQTGNSVFGGNEGGKWSRYIGATLIVKSDDWTTRYDTTVLQSVLGNTLTVSPALSFTPQPEDTVILSVYNDMTGEVGDTLKLIYGWQSDVGGFDDSSMPYQML